jgi:hypothetical protein
MSVTASGALAVIRSQLEASPALSITMYWQGDDPPILPDTPAAFAYIVFNNDGSPRGPTSFGGGVGRNLYRSNARLEAYVFMPSTGALGMEPVMDKAELIAARLRSYRSGDVSCYAANVDPVGPGSSISPPGFNSVVSNYYCAVAVIDIQFDTIG